MKKTDNKNHDPLAAFEIFGWTVLILAALYGALQSVVMLLAAGGG